MKKTKGSGLFDWQELRYAWYRHKLIGVIKWVARRLRFARQRVCQGYCDMDVWNLYDWFLDVVPDMLQQLKETGVGYPCSEGPTVSQSISLDAYNQATGKDKTISDDEQAAFERGQAEWHARLDKMIFLFHEADEDRCERKNTHEEAFQAAYQEFREKYGVFGERLRKPEEENGISHRLYTLHDVEEYRDIADKYTQEEREIDTYRMKCKDEAFQLFSQWFYALWD